MTTSRPRLCDLCHEPAESLTIRLRPGDPGSPRVAVRHDPCYRVLVETQAAAMAAETQRGER